MRRVIWLTQRRKWADACSDEMVATFPVRLELVGGGAGDGNKE